MWGLPQKQNARRADKIRLCGHLRRYKKIVKKTYIIWLNSYVYPQEAYDYIVSLNEKCGSYIKNGANCGEDCIQYLNRKPTTKTGNIYYRIIELERN